VQQLPEQIAQRYGKSPKQEAQRRRAIIITASLITALFATWAVWANLTAKNKPANSTAICAVQALKEDYGIVAYKEVKIPATSPEDGSITDVPVKVSLRSTELAVTGLVDRCWYE
jgi:hypothetical protein